MWLLYDPATILLESNHNMGRDFAQGVYHRTVLNSTKLKTTQTSITQVK